MSRPGARRGRRQARGARIESLEARIQQKNEVLAELMGEHVALKKRFFTD